MSLKIGDKVRNLKDNMEGKVTWSSFGASIIGFYNDKNGDRIHFQTLGQPIQNYEDEWVKVDKFEYNMKKHN